MESSQKKANTKQEACSAGDPEEFKRCGECGKDVEMISYREASIIANLPVEKIMQLASRSRFHEKENPSGELFICLNSFMRAGISD